MRKALVLLLLPSSVIAGHFRDFSFADPGHCAPLLGGTPVRSRSTPRAGGPMVVTKSAAFPAQRRYAVRDIFDAVRAVVVAKDAELRAILSEFNSYYGTQFEMAQTLSLLENAYRIEGWHLENTRPLASAAVYASTNVPLYTFIAHGVVPSILAKDVWFRTPETTRKVYRAIFELFSKHLPPGMLDGLHVLHESQDVQYDNFARMYVLGTNKKGTQYQREPADLVLFTGSPETARRILERTEAKLKERPTIFPSFDQLFLGFGAGMNPFIVTPSATTDLDRVANEILLPSRMNAGQDCMVPNFYVVHESLLPTLIPLLKQKIAAMHFGSNTDPDADYTALELTKDFTRLEAYRATYGKNLLNPEAVIDRDARIVSPHLYLFDPADFDNLLLQEHYGPVYSLVPYKTLDDLKKIARDPRVQAQRMYAIVAGGRVADAHTNEVERLFQQYGHSVAVNDTLFQVEASNMPFGGQGYQSSIIHTTRKAPDGRIVINSGHHAVSITTQAFTYFGLTSSPARDPLRPQAEAKQELATMLALATGDPDAITEMPASWRELVAPQGTNRRTGLAYLREVMATEGLVRVMPHELAAGHTAEALQTFFGSALTFPSPDGSRDVRWGTGVAIHPSAVGSTVPALNQFRGRVNPHLGRGFLLPMLDGNKQREAHLVEAVKPGMMAFTTKYTDLMKAGRLHAGLPAMQARAEKAIDAIVKQGPGVERNEEARRALEAWVQQVFVSVQNVFPEGAFFKNFGEFATADLGTQVTTFGSNYRHIAAQFLRRLFAAAPAGSSADYRSADFQTLMGEDPWEMGTRFLNTLLVAPGNLLAQGRVPIARTELGFPLEFRVDFIDGEPVLSKLRFSHEYLPEEAEEAARQLLEFFKAAPPEFRHLSGGADMARLTDGTWVIIEFNFGANSGSMWPQYFPVDANQFIANLTGKTTPFLASLEQVHAGGLEAQRRYLLDRKVEKELWWKASLEDFSRVEAARWFRNRLLDDLRRAPITEDRAEVALAHLKALYEGMASPKNDDFEKLYAGAENYVRRRMLAATAAPPLAAAKSAARALGAPTGGVASPTKPLTTRALGRDFRPPFAIPTSNVPRGGTRRGGGLESDHHDVPSWPDQWMRQDADLPAALQMHAFLLPMVEALIRNPGQRNINAELEAMYKAANAVAANFATDDRLRLEPIPALREALRRRGHP